MSAAEVRILVQPRASRAEVGGERDGASSCGSPCPADGRANDAARALLARRLRVAPSRVAITAGHTSRRKTVRIEGLTTTEAIGRLVPGA